jgi:hypothetical protein
LKRSPLGTRVKGFTFLPTNSPKAFFLPLVDRDEMETPTSQDVQLPSTNNQKLSFREDTEEDEGTIPLHERWNFLVEFIEHSASSPLKVCFDAKQSLKPILKHKMTCNLLYLSRYYQYS